jgi:hypothetical protein
MYAWSSFANKPSNGAVAPFIVNQLSNGDETITKLITRFIRILMIVQISSFVTPLTMSHVSSL